MAELVTQLILFAILGFTAFQVFETERLIRAVQNLKGN